MNLMREMKYIYDRSHVRERVWSMLIMIVMSRSREVWRSLMLECDVRFLCSDQTKN